jgi:ribonucleotide reductase beta subunit family protein with ferritin-like domain
MDKKLLNSKLLNNASIVSTEEDEYLLNPENNRLTIYPIKDMDIWNAYLIQLGSFWTPGELDFSKDSDDYKNKLTTNEQYFIKMVLAFFSSADSIVNINLGERFTSDVKIREAVVCYDFQKMMENIHCVSADTKILTDTGYYEIEKLLNTKVKVWNGQQFSDTIVKYTGDSELYEVTLSNHSVLKCTPEHKWFIQTENFPHLEFYKKSIVFTKDLKLNDVIYSYDLPIVNTTDPDEFLNPYVHGFFCGDGTYSNKINKHKFEVPINYSLSTKLRWFEGYCDSDGYIVNKKGYPTIHITNINLDFIKNVQLMLNTMGINPWIKIANEERTRSILMSDGREEEKECYVMYIDSSDLIKLLNLGFEPRRLVIDANYKNVIDVPNKKLLKIINITKLESIHKTYCFNEEKEHSGIFNGILTGQSETYSLQIENIIKDSEEKEQLFKAVEHFDCIAEKANWALGWIESDKSFAHRLIAFAIMEGVFFSGSFCAIYWLKKRNVMPGLCASNELIARDESSHTLFAVLLYSKLKNKISQTEVHDMFLGAVEIETKFICESLPCSMLGMNSDMMTQYIKYVADRLLLDLGYSKLFNVTNPFDFMESICLEGKKNFFEGRPTQYQKASVLNKTKDVAFNFSNNF